MEEKSAAPAVKKKKKKIKRSPILTGIIAAVLLLAALAVLTFVFRERLTGEGEAPEAAREAFTYENGSGQTFALVGDGLAVASSSSIQLLGSDGLPVVKDVCSMTTPAITSCGSAALFFDVGGTLCRLAVPDGTVTEIEISGAIISAAMNASGYFTVISEEPGYKGLVQVFDPLGALVYKWWSGSAYPLKAQVSPDCKNLAVLCINADGSLIKLFSLSSEEEQASAVFYGDLLFDMYYMGADSICAISHEKLCFISGSGASAGEYSLGGKYLSCYSFTGSGFAAVCLSEYSSGAGCSIVTIDSAGKELGSLAREADVSALYANGKQLLVMGPGDISLYSQSLQTSSTVERLMTAKTAVLRPKGDALLLSAYSAERFSF